MRCFAPTSVTLCLVGSLLLGTATAFAAPTRGLSPTPALSHGRLGSREWQATTATTRSTSIHSRHERTQLHLALTFPRGGAAAATTAATTLLQKASQWKATPQALFNSLLLGLALTTATAKVWQSVEAKRSGDGPAATKSASAKSMQVRFLSVFWLLRCSDWLQGPYFYEVYASKIFNGAPASMALVSRLFLTGFASTALFGPLVGRAADEYGRKKATLAFSVIYALGAWSTKSPLLTVLLVGRALSGIGTSLLFSAPESWLVGEAQATDNQDCLGETFGLAYAGDSLVAISAGQMAGWAASQRGPSGPFELSTGFLAAGGILAAFLWKENKAPSSAKEDKPSIREAVQVIRRDPKIMLVGAVQSLFEAAMYIFVLQWPPAMATAIGQNFGAAAKTPYGSVFSCFMASCLLGSTMFGQLAKKAVSTEASTAVMLAVATVAMTAATWTIRSAGATNLPCLIASLFCFEACVGMYFPSIGTLRSRYVPDSHRSVIMNLFGIPLNVLVVAVFLSIHKLGLAGALSISSAALGVATLAMTQLWRRTAAPAAATSSA